MSRAACSTMSLGETARRETSSGEANSRHSSLGMLSPADYETRLRPPDHTCEVSGERGQAHDRGDTTPHRRHVRMDLLTSTGKPLPRLWAMTPFLGRYFPHGSCHTVRPALPGQRVCCGSGYGIAARRQYRSRADGGMDVSEFARWDRPPSGLGGQDVPPQCRLVQRDRRVSPDEFVIFVVSLVFHGE
jgi:hypothetical protein